MTSAPPPPTPEIDGHPSEVIVQGGFKSVEGQRKELAKHGVRAQVVCPPGTDLNG